MDSIHPCVVVAVFHSCNVQVKNYVCQRCSREFDSALLLEVHRSMESSTIVWMTAILGNFAVNNVGGNGRGWGLDHPAILCSIFQGLRYTVLYDHVAGDSQRAKEEWLLKLEKFGYEEFANLRYLY